MRSLPTPVTAAIATVAGGVLAFCVVAAFIGKFGWLVLPLLLGGVLVNALWQGHRAAPVLAILVALASVALAVGVAPSGVTALVFGWAGVVVLLVTRPSALDWFRTPQQRVR